MSVTDRLAALTPEQRALFERLREAQKKAAAPPRHQPPPMRRAAGPRDQGFPLSYAQQRLWFLQQLNPESPAYNLAVGVRFLGALEPAALAAAVNEVVRRHETLRTRFPLEDGRPVQVITPPQRTDPAPIDLSALSAACREGELRRLLREMAARPFDLESGPLLRTFLFRLAVADHVLLATLHHIVADAWSGAVLVQEVGALYVASMQGRPAFLPALPIQYADYAVWQRSWLTGEVLQAELDWWRERLAGAPPRIELPADRPRADSKGRAGWRAGKLRAALPPALSQRLAQLGQREGATLFQVLMAAFQILIGRLGAQDDLPVATVVANRLQPEIEPLIGFFVNTLVVRGRLGGDDTFLSFLHRTRAGMIAVTQHQEVSFEQVVEAVRPQRMPGETPFFQALFALQNAPSPEAELPGLRFAAETADSGEAKIDLALQLSETAAGLAGEWAGEWEYRADLFDASTVARMAEHFHNLLQAAVDDPERGVFALPLLSAAERHQALVEWNEEAGAALDGPPVHLQIAAVAAAHPAAPALVFPGGIWSYGELDRRAGALARRLRERGIGPERIVAVCAERSPEMILGLLAVLAAGGAYLPFDPRLPAERLRFLWEDAGRPLILAPEALLPALPTASLASWVPLEAPAAVPAEPGAGAAIDGGHAAYLIYTSGSTGQPKGTLVTHRELRRRIAGLARLTGIGAGSRVLQLSAFSFDGSVAEIFGSLTRGAELHLVTPEEALPGTAFVRVLRERRITHAFSTPQILLASPAEELPDLVRLIVGGEAWPAELAGQWGSGRVANGYGPTETAVIATLGFGIRPGEKPAIGRPVEGTRAAVLDPGFAPVPIGTAGELWLAGAGLARGYLRRPDLTADRFRPDPSGDLWSEPGARMYRTGDLARQLPDGRIDFLGRGDDQVKIRGFRIEPGEIEAALLAHPRVAEAVVVMRGDWGGERRLVAYCVPAAGAAASDAPLLAALRGHLAALLPDYMVPAAIVVLPELPLNASAKVDRARLPSPGDLAGPETDDGAGAAPRTPAEELVAGIWADLLDLPRVGRRDDFFALGGHSLLATRVVSRLREAAGVELPVREVFTSPTVAALAAALEAALAAESGDGPPPIRPVPRDGALPLSFAQERLWFLDRLAPGSTAYTIPLVLAAHGSLSVPAMEAALGEMVRRHEALRTTYAARGDRPVQIIAPPGRRELPLVDLGALPEERRREEARSLSDAAVARPFDLERDPVLRAAAVRLGPAEHVLLLTVHHIAADGWSIGVMVEEIAALYAPASAPAILPELAVQYADFAVWQRDWLRGEVLERQLAYWRRELADAPALDLPTDRPRPPAQSFRGATRMHRIGPETARGIAGLARRTDATLFMVLLAAVQTLLGRYAGQDDVVLGSPIANRTRAEVEPLIGFFVNTLVLRGDLSGDPPFTGLVARSRRLALEAYAHQDLPFERLVEELRPERRLANNPLFQVMLAVQNTPLRPIELPGLTFSPVGFDVPATRFDLEIFFTEVADGLAVQLSWSTDLFDEPTVLRLAEHLDALLAAVLEDPDRRLSDLTATALLTPPQRHQLLAEWNDTAAELPRADVFSLFAAQARRRPGAVALISEEGDLTYGELHARAVRLAHRLAAAGVGPEIRVAILAQRSPALIAGLLGILGAGGAYVPLDPSYPAERLAWMLADCGARVLLAPRELLAEIPPGTAPLVLELADDPLGSGEAASDLAPVPPDALAYVMYTSGSTGRPKGVGVTHRNIVRLVRESGFADLGEEQVFLQLAPVSFDASTLEIWAPLLNGGRLAVFPPRRPSLEELGEAIARRGVTTLWLTAGLFHEMVDGGLEALRPLHQLLAGGDVLSPSHVRRVLAGLPGLTLINGYGPTEGTTFTCCYRMTSPEEAWSTVPIGRPIGNTRLHILDDAGRPVPMGAWGELLAGGAGISRGYPGRPDLTAERFVPDPWSALPGERLYRTGDIVRHRPDGRIEIRGRRDEQIKLRGFRIELGEIEGALVRHPAVGAAAVTARDDGGPAGRRLVAYVVPRPDGRAAFGEEGEDLQHVEQWRALYDQTYAQGPPPEAGGDAAFNVQGWNSSYTGEPIPAAEMREWLEGTVGRLRALPHRRVLEVGCGTGLLLFRLAPEAELYRGTDFSAVALAQVRAELERRGLPRVELAQGLADDWTGVAPGTFDLVVLNSVVQYFPDVDYLVRVLTGAVAAVAPGGAVFVGDVRSLPLLEAFHTSVELFQSPGSRSIAELKRRVRRRVADEEELLLDPTFFLALARRLPGIQSAELLLKPGQAHNELTRFRYDVVLRVGEGLAPEVAGELRLTGLLNARLTEEAAALALLASETELETVEELRRALSDLTDRSDRSDRSDPTDLTRRGAAPGPGLDLPWSAYANDPLRAGAARRLVPELRRFLEAELPDYMVPAAFVVFAALPLTTNGKVDRAALPEPESPGAPAGSWIAPSTPLEELIARVAAEILGVERVGMQDSFFDLGGHSLLATQLTSRLTREHGIAMTLQMIFDAPTLGDLADRIVEQELAAADGALLDEMMDEMEGLSAEEEGAR